MRPTHHPRLLALCCSAERALVLMLEQTVEPAAARTEEQPRREAGGVTAEAARALRVHVSTFLELRHWALRRSSV